MSRRKPIPRARPTQRTRPSAGTPDARNVLLIHQNFPGQFKHLAHHLAGEKEVRLLAIGRKTAPGSPEGPPFISYDLARAPGTRTHRYVRPIESAVLYGQAVVRVLLELRNKGFLPDVVLAHIGWGEALYVKDVFPDTRLIGLCEFYHHGSGVDLGFDPEFPATIDDRLRVRTGNGHMLVTLDATDIGVSATEFQKSLFPAAYRSKIRVIHEGIDTSAVTPDPTATLTLSNGRVLRNGDRVVTYVARNLEPYRGFHVFMRAAERMLRRDPRMEIVVVGGDGVSYGRKPPREKTWREQMLAEVTVDPNRIHFLGWTPYETYRRVLQVSAVHVYLTYPFVLSWSLTEAMSAQCLIVASDTAPVREVIEDRRTGLLVDFFSIDDLATRVLHALDHPERFTRMREAARETVGKRFAVEDSLRRYRELIGLPPR